jgi:hypothetical protein
MSIRSVPRTTARPSSPANYATEWLAAAVAIERCMQDSTPNTIGQPYVLPVAAYKSFRASPRFAERIVSPSGEKPE